MRPLLVDVIEPDAAVISLARRYFEFDPPAWRYSSASPASLASRNFTLLQTYAGSARLSRVRLIETDALSWLRGAARPDLRPLTTHLLTYLRLGSEGRPTSSYY